MSGGPEACREVTEVYLYGGARVDTTQWTLVDDGRTLPHVVEHRSSLPAESRIALSLDLLRRPKASSGSTPEEEAGLRGYHEAWGYVFWIPLIVIVFLVPELTAAAGAAICHLPTFSTTVGHLEYVWKL